MPQQKPYGPRKKYRSQHAKSNSEMRHVKERNICNRTYYLRNQEKIKAAPRAHYYDNPNKKRSASRAQYSADRNKKLLTMRTYRACNKESINAYKRDKYVLSEPKPAIKDTYMKDLESNLFGNKEAKAGLSIAFKQQQSIAKRENGKEVCKIAAKRLLKSLQVRRENAGSLLKTVRTVQSMQISSADDFGEGCHMASTEPYFYDSAYKPVKRDYALPIDEFGKCVLAKEITGDSQNSKYKCKNQPMKWACTSECKIPTVDEVHAIVELKEAFDKPIQEVRQALNICDSNCPNQHYTKVVGNAATELQGHPLVCFNNGGCCSKMRILRSAATHFSVLATMLCHMYSAVNSHQCVKNIDNALSAGDFHTLMEITKLSDFATLLSNEVETTYEQCTETADKGIVHPGVEIQLLTKHAQLITELEKN